MHLACVRKWDIVRLPSRDLDQALAMLLSEWI